MATVALFYLLAFVGSAARAQEAANGSASVAWSNYAHDSQHTALSETPSRSLKQILWQTPVDLQPQYSGDELLIHYGSPLVTAGNTVLLPVKTGASGGFRVEGRLATDGSLLWSQTSDYILPPHNW